MQLALVLKCQTKNDTWDSNWHVLVAKQCQLNLNFWTTKGKRQNRYNRHIWLPHC